jgi:hypothetical protein
MDRHFAARRDQLLADAEVDPRLLRGILPRLERFLDPFVELLQRSEQSQHSRHYVAGLLSTLPYKNVESIAYLHDEAREPLQQFIGQSPWDHGPWLTELAKQVGQQLGSPDGVLVFDPSAFPKKGTASVAVQRQWCGRLGKIDNCQVGIYLAYVGRTEHALVDVRLYLPKEWANDRKRREAAGVPRSVRFRTRHELALEMLDEHGSLLPHDWISGDDELGRCTRFRQQLRARGERYLLAVPSNTLVRDLAAADPPYAGHGRRPSSPWTVGVPRCRRRPGRRWRSVRVKRVLSRCRPFGRWCKRAPRAACLMWWRPWWCSARRKGMGRGSTTTCCPMKCWTHPCGNTGGCSRPSTGWKSAWSGPRGRRAWRTMRCGLGVGGITTKHWP